MKFAENLDRVQRFAKPRVSRLLNLLCREVSDPRKSRGKRHKLHHVLEAVLAGLLANCSSLRDVEELSAELRLGREHEGVSDTATGHLLEKLNPSELLAVLAQQVYDMNHRGELKPDGLPLSVATVDGKNLATLQHHGGGAGHMRISPDESTCWWLMPALRSVLTSAAGRPALGQWMQRPGHGEITEFVPFFEWLHETYGKRGLIDVFDVDAGFTSLATFDLVDSRGYGVVMNLKGNQPELHAFATSQLGVIAQRQPALAATPSEATNGVRITRELWQHELTDGYLGWRRLRQIWLVRQTTKDKNGNVLGVEDRYFITNLAPDRLAPAQILRLVRRHWGIENDCFKSLDVQWKEDSKPWWTEGAAVPVLGLLRLMAYNIVQGLRKRHLCHRVAGRSWPTQWRKTFDLIKAALLELARLGARPVCSTAPS